MSEKCDQLQEYIVHLEEKLQHLKEEVAYLQDRNRERNIELDALHYVWCDGTCEAGVHRWTDTPLTKELVEAAVSNTNRLIRKWNNLEFVKLDEIEPTIKDVHSYRHTYHKLHKQLEAALDFIKETTLNPSLSGLYIETWEKLLNVLGYDPLQKD
jgi:hypothetical protein